MLHLRCPPPPPVCFCLPFNRTYKTIIKGFILKSQKKKKRQGYLEFAINIKPHFVFSVKVLFHEDGSVKGIATNDVGIAKDGSPKVQ